MSKVNLAEILSPAAVVLDREPFQSKDEMFRYMVDRFAEAGVITSRTAYLKALYEREDLGPTYMGSLIGLPHGRCDEVVKSAIGFCRCKEPFLYESYGEVGEVQYVFMLAISGTQGGDEYMRVLATLAGLLMNEQFLEIVKNCSDYEELLEGITQFTKRNEEEV